MWPPSPPLLHRVTPRPAALWRVPEGVGGGGGHRGRERRAERGYRAEARAQLGHGGRGPAADYSLAALAADNLAMGDHDLVVGHSLGAPAATPAAARRPQWAGRLVLVDPAWRFPTTGEAPAVK